MYGFLKSFVDIWLTADAVFSFVMTIVILIMLNAMALMSRKLRVMVHELESLRKDQSVISDELEIVATAHEPSAAAAAKR
ncbi:MAG: hypothetical protein V1495_03370 [Pseudomonadota bacterium]